MSTKLLAALMVSLIASMPSEPWLAPELPPIDVRHTKMHKRTKAERQARRKKRKQRGRK